MTTQASGTAMALLEKYALLNSHIEQTRKVQQERLRSIEETKEIIELNRARRAEMKVRMYVSS